MKHKILSALAISVIFLLSTQHASAQSIHAKYYGYGDKIPLTSTTPTDLLTLTLSVGETNRVCFIEATGYVSVESSQAVLKVWVEVDGGSNGSTLATDEEVTRRYIRAKSGALQSSFHTSLVKVFDECCQNYTIRLVGTNFSGKGSLYVNYHGLTASCFNYGDVTVLHPGVGISGHVYEVDGTTPVSGVEIRGFPSGGVATTDSNGFYSRTVSDGWSGVLTPCYPGGGPCFSPPSRTYTNVTSSLANQDYTKVLSLVPCPPCP